MELCNIMELLDVNGYDLSCFDLASCKPQNIQELIQFLIERICALEDVDAAAAATPTTTGSTKSTSADTLVTVAPCFVIGTTTVMPVSEYAIAMGTRICSIIDQINIINIQINNLDVRVTTLETTPVPVFTIPTFTLGCNIGALASGTTNGIDVILEEYINNVWCGFYATTGSITDLSNAIASQCILGTDFTKVNPAATYAMQYPNWIQPTTTIADLLNNAWIVLCDIYNGSVVTITPATTNTIQTIVTGGPAYTISSKILDTGWVNLDGFDFYTGADTDSLRPRVRRIGNVLHFKGQVMIPIDDGAGAPLLWQYQNVPPVDTYYLSTTVTPASVGPGSVIASTSGLITFNQGNFVIPSTVMSVFETIDDNYTKNFTIGSRRTQIDNAPDTSTILTTVANLTITSSKTLAIALVKNGEQNNFSGTNAFDTSHLNYIISHVRTGEYVPKFSSLNTNVNSNAASGTVGLDMEYDVNLRYQFDCNANDESNLGGFIFQLDGLIAYINPCTTDIPTPIVCP
jgi:hypothetical protein